MLSSQYQNLNAQLLSQPQKLGKEFIKVPQDAAQETESKTEVADKQGAVSWYSIEEEDGNLKLTAVPNTNQVDVSTVNVHAEEVSAPKDLNLFGYKIDLKSKIEGFKESYVKNYALTKSHNLLVARFAEMKVAFFGQLLSILGCTSEEVRKLQKKAMVDTVKQNKILFEENEYNAELLAIVGGGGKKQIGAQQKVIGEIRKQLVTQANNLGLNNYYTKERIIDIQIAQCEKIKRKFEEEKNNLQYQLAFFGVN
jgi:hypothetical protein